MEDRLSAPWAPWEAAPVAIAAFVSALILAIVLTAALGGPGGSTAVLSELGFEAAIFGSTIAWVRIRYPGAVSALRLRSRRTGRDAFVGGLAGAVVFFATAILLLQLIVYLLEIFGRPPPAIRQIRFELDPLNLALGLVLVVVAAPFAEELFFRGFLYTSLRSRFGLWPAVLMSSAIFGVFHLTGGPVLVPLLFVVGIVFALLYEWRKSLVAPIAAHAVFNAIGYAFIVYERTIAT